MDNLILASHSDIGDRRDTYEDRGYVNNVRTAGGLQLSLAIIADGVGGEERGQRAAQLAIDSALQVISASQRPMQEVPDILMDAVEYANQVVFSTAVNDYSGQMMATTLTIAAVLQNTNSPRLFIVNVGDSRVYLVRDGKLSQLTIDHNFGIVKHWPGELNADQLNAGFGDEVLMRAMGIAPEVRPDIGFYVNTQNPQEAEDRGWDGLPLQAGDSILVCSDGLIKFSGQPGPNYGKPYTTDAEIINTLQSQEGELAAKKLISYATGRGTDDNVTVSLIQLPDPNRKMRGMISQYKWVGLAVLGLIAALVVVGVMFSQANTERQELAANNTQQAEIVATREQNAANATSTAAAWTPTPSPTPRPTRIVVTVNAANANVLGSVVSLDTNQPQDIQMNQLITASDENVMLISQGLPQDAAPASVYSNPGSRILYSSIQNNTVSLNVFSGSEVIVDNGSYGATKVEIGNPQFQAQVAGSVMSVRFPNESQASLLCYEGSCSFSTDFGQNFQPIQERQGVQIDLMSGIPNFFNIDANNAQSDGALLEQFGETAAETFQLAILPLLPTATPVPPPSDIDGDGIPDYRDNCPREFGSVVNFGCPEIATNTPVPRRGSS